MIEEKPPILQTAIVLKADKKSEGLSEE